MFGVPVDLGTLIIPAQGGDQFSPALDLTKGGIRGLGIYSPAATPAGTITIEVSADGTRFVTLTSGGSDVAIGASECVVVDALVFKAVRLATSSAAETTKLPYELIGQEDIT